MQNNNSLKNPLIWILGLSFFFFIIFIGVTFKTFFSLGVYSQPSKGMFQHASAIGVLEINGVIMDSKKSLKRIDQFAEDHMIKGVLVRINSPGGAVAPSQEVFEALKKLNQKKPVYASMNSLAASGGYYVALASKKIYANPGTITGSIGVIMQFADLSKLYQWAKVNSYSIKTGKFKDIGSPTREMTLEEKQLLQGMIDNVLEQFRKAVATSRGLPMEKVEELSDGRIFSGEQAKAVKLVDELGTFSDAVDALAKEAKISGKPKLVYFAKKKHLIERLLDDDEDEDEYESSSDSDGKFSGSVLGKILNAILLIEKSGISESVGPLKSNHYGPMFLIPGYHE